MSNENDSEFGCKNIISTLVLRYLLYIVALTGKFFVGVAF